MTPKPPCPHEDIRVGYDVTWYEMYTTAKTWDAIEGAFYLQVKDEYDSECSDSNMDSGAAWCSKCHTIIMIQWDNSCDKFKILSTLPKATLVEVELGD